MSSSIDSLEQRPPKVEKTSAGKKRGGQAGHVILERELIPAEQCVEVKKPRPAMPATAGSQGPTRIHSDTR
jgi:hypothetical protein